MYLASTKRATYKSLAKYVLNKSLANRNLLNSGFIQASMRKFQGLFKGFKKASPTVFKDLKLMKNTDQSVNFFLQKC